MIDVRIEIDCSSSGITSSIPISPAGRDVIHVAFKENVDHSICYYEKKVVSHNEVKQKKVITYQIEHQVIDSNPQLNVALVKFDTSMRKLETETETTSSIALLGLISPLYLYLDNGDGINLYCIKNLCPLLGDHRYSSRVKKLFGRPMLVPDQEKVKPETQVNIQDQVQDW